MNFAIMLNPFIRIAGFSALLYGCVIMFLTAAIAAEPAKAPMPEDAEHVEIAKKFVERFFADTDDDPLEQFPAIEEMKEFVSVASFKHWSKKIITDYGNLGGCVKIEVIRHNQFRRSVFLFFHGERQPVKMWVTFDGTLISGFHYDTWRESAGAAKIPVHILLTLSTCLLLPVLIFLIIYYGEKWRGRWVKARNQDVEAFNVEQTFDTVYCESQNPLWGYLLTLVILIPILLLMFLDRAIPFEATIVLVGGTVFVVCLMFLILLGIFIEVGEESVIVRMGGMRIRIMRFPFDSIASVEVMSFNPLWDFGGWGPYRFGRGGIIGCFMSGTRGVLLQKNNGQKYLLGSDTPDRLAAVIRSQIEKNQSAD